MLQGGLGGALLNIHPHGMVCPQKQGGNGEDAAAAAHVQDLLPALDQVLQLLQAQVGGVMLTGTKAGTGIDL